jgi:hypothetical protein
VTYKDGGSDHAVAGVIRRGKFFIADSNMNKLVKCDWSVYSNLLKYKKSHPDIKTIKVTHLLYANVDFLKMARAKSILPNFE